MSELSKKYQDISNGLVDVYRLLSSEKAEQTKASDLLACSMNMGNYIGLLENKKSDYAFAEVYSSVIIEIGACEFMLKALIKSGLIPKKMVAKIFRDCVELCDLIKLKQEGSL